MNKTIRIVHRIMVGLSLWACLLPVHAAPVTSTPAETKVINALFENQTARFPMSQACGQDPGNPVTVREFLQTSLVFLAQEPAGDSRVRVKCNTVKNNKELIDYYQSLQGEFANALSANLRKLKKNEKLSQCEVSFNHKANEHVWSRGVQFLFQDKTGRALASSFRCIMTP